jgi:hypothetical protein
VEQKGEYLKDKINEFETNNKNKNTRGMYRGLNEFKKVYQPRTNLVKDQNGDMIAESYNVLNRWKNYFCRLLNVHGDNSQKCVQLSCILI